MNSTQAHIYYMTSKATTIFKALFVFLFCFGIIGSPLIHAQVVCPTGPGGPSLNAGPDTTIQCGQCATLNANVGFGFAPTSYTVSQIPFVPFANNVGTLVQLSDDQFSSVINLPFPFCFYGVTYNSCIIGSNGLVSFAVGGAGGYCQWPINAAVPNAGIPFNCVMNPWVDINPGVGGQIRWTVVGAAPCREFVASWVNVPLYACSNLLTTFQCVLYETTNVIETYIQNKSTGCSWNGGYAIEAIHQTGGIAGLAVAGRNWPTQWGAQNDGRRYTPAGAQTHVVNWTQGANVIGPNGTQVCPIVQTTYTATVTYTNCNGTTSVLTDNMVVSASGTIVPMPGIVTNVSCNGGANGSATINVVGSPSIYQFLWDDPLAQTTQTATGLVAGQYICNAIDTVNCIIGSCTLTVTEPPAINLVISAVDVLCNGTSTGTLSVVATGGTPGFTYLWNSPPPNNTTANVNNVPAGNYQVIVTDANLCRDTATITINQPTPLTAVINTTPTLCFGSGDGTATAVPSGGVGPYSYQWTTNSGPQYTATATGLYAGTYNVNVIDFNGCVFQTSATITQPTDVVLQTTTVDAICFGSATGTATVLASGGMPGYTYQWSNGQGNATATALIAGNYTVWVTDINGCRDSATVTILEPPPMGMVITTIPVSCMGFSDGQMYAVMTGGTLPYSYLWSPGNYTTQGVTNVAAGSYTITVTDGQGCSVTQVAVVGFPAPPIANAGPDANFCEGEGGAQIWGSATGGQGSPYYYTWTCNQPICGLDSVFDNDPIANPTITTTYYLVVTDQRGCTSAPDSVVVTVKPKPIVNAGPDLYLCEAPDTGSFIQASISNAPGPFIYNWTPSLGLNNANIEDPYARPLVTTIYYLTVISSNGCESDFNTTDTLSAVTVHVTPQPVANAGPDQSICYTSSTILNGTGTGGNGTYAYQWSPATGLSDPNIANPTAVSSFTTIYILTVISNGCPSHGDTMTLSVETNPTNDAGPDRDFCVGQSAVLEGSVGGVLGNPNFDFHWTPATGLNDPDVAMPVASPTQTTMYYLNTTSPSGCVSTPDSVLVTVNPSPFPDGGLNLHYCEGTGGIQLNGSYSWFNNVQPPTMADFFIRWTPQDGTLSDSTIVNPIADPHTTTYYYITTTNLTCSYTDSVLVVVVPELNSVATADTNTICEHDSVQLHAFGGQTGASYSWSPATGLSDPNSANPWASPGTSGTYTVTVSESGCSESVSVNISVIESPEVSFVNSLPNGCADLTVSFLETTANALNWIWNFGDGSPVENTQNPSHVYTQVGTYYATLTGTGPGDCKTTYRSEPITVYPGPVGDFTSNPGFPVQIALPNTEVSFTPKLQNAVWYLWDFGDGQTSTDERPSHLYNAEGSYEVTLLAKNEIGCMTEIKHGPYLVVAPDLSIPNIFSPNGDGINDRFQVLYTGSQHFSLEIRDRWGVPMYKSVNKTQGWDGNAMNSGSAAAEGVYYYTLKIGETGYSGPLTLVR